MNKYIAIEKYYNNDYDCDINLYWIDDTLINNLPNNITYVKLDEIPNLKLYTMYRCVYNIFQGSYRIFDEVYTYIPSCLNPIYPTKEGVLYTDVLTSIQPSKNEAIVACQEMATQVLKNDPVIDTSDYFEWCPYKYISRTYLENNDWVWKYDNKIFDFRKKQCTIDGMPYKHFNIAVSG